jgi:hypothetical protein
MKNKYIIMVLLIGSAILWSCNDDILDLTNPNSLTPEVYYKTPAQLDQAVAAVYSAVRGDDLLALDYFFLSEFQSDDAVSGGDQCPGYQADIVSGKFNSSNDEIFHVWRGWYAVIMRANAVIEKAPQVEKIDEALRKERVAEAKVLRAWAYFELTMNWGKIPIYTTYGKSMSDFKPRSEVAEVYSQIITDLNDAIPDLYSEVSQEGRINQYTAIAFLGKAYMQRGNQGDYTLAKEQFEKIVNSQKYALSANYLDNFVEEVGTNNESLFQINYGGGAGEWNICWAPNGDSKTDGAQLRHQWIAAGHWRNMMPSNSLLAEYEENDPRLKYTVYFTGDTANVNWVLTDDDNHGYKSSYKGQTIACSWRKSTICYKQTESWMRGYYGSRINQRVIRYAEILLNLAECQHNLGNDAAALVLLNQVRGRETVKMPNFPTAAFPCNSPEEVFKAIAHERRVELGFEEVRANDLKRWKKEGKIQKFPYVYTPKNPDGLMPIPLAEINGNPAIGQANQNAGY